LTDDDNEQYHNIFLDFFNRDSREIYELTRILGEVEHVRELRQALNLAVFLCRDYCIMPPGFVAEDAIVRKTLSQTEAYTYERLIRWPIKESLDEYWAKKEVEYALVRDSYRGLFDEEAQRFVEQNARLLIDRHTSIGSELVARWEAAPDTSSYWRAATPRVSAAVVDTFRRVPRLLYDDGVAVTWRSIERRIPEVAAHHRRYRTLVQHLYFDLYIQEFDLRVLSGLPIARISFGNETSDNFYSYEALRHVLAPSGTWELLLDMSPWDMVRLRGLPDYFAFRKAVARVCRSYATLYGLREGVAVSSTDIGAVIEETSVIERSSGPRQLVLGLWGPGSDGRSSEWLEAFALRLRRTAELAENNLMRSEAKASSARQRIAALRHVLHSGLGGSVTVAVFAALDEERLILIRRWGLRPVSGQYSQWSGELGGVTLLLYGPDRMGRVPAAVATARVLNQARPDMIIVTGLAGGFRESGIESGAILLPANIADLALRRVGEEGAQIRPDPYELDLRLSRYIRTELPEESWRDVAIEEAEWPNGRRPHLEFDGTVACIDAIVADDDYRARLLDAWPRIKGVEMEAGGVLHAARELGQIPVSVVRAVSDMADPVKADDVWRRCGILTIAVLLERVNFAAMLNFGRDQ